MNLSKDEYLELVRHAYHERGFRTHMRKLAARSIEDRALIKQAVLGQLGRFFGKVAPRLEMATPAAAKTMTGSVGSGLGQLASTLGGGAAKGLWGLAKMPFTLAGGAVQGATKPFGGGLARAGETFNRALNSPIRFGRPGQAAAPANPFAAPANPTAQTVGAAPAAAPGISVAPGVSPGNVPAQAASAPGANVNWTSETLGRPPWERNFSAAEEAVGTSGGAGDPTHGLLEKARGLLPKNVQEWALANPGLAYGGLGAVGGGGAMYGMNAYGDARRRQALENLGMLQRMGLAFQLATNPQGFANTLNL